MVLTETKSFSPFLFSKGSKKSVSVSSTDLFQVQVKTLKKNHPAVVMVATFCFGYFVVYQFGCILVFLSGVIFPFIFMIIHASLRLRNAKNKVAPVIIFDVFMFSDSIYHYDILGKCCQE